MTIKKLVGIIVCPHCDEEVEVNSFICGFAQCPLCFMEIVDSEDY